MYFNYFQYLKYPYFNKNNVEVITSDIFKRIIVRSDLIPDASNYYEYVMEDGDSLESLANDLYGTPYYYWVLLLLNTLFEPRFDLYLPQEPFANYIISKYGSIEDASNRSDEYSATYSRSGDVITVTTSGHNLLNGRKVFLDFSNRFNGVYTIVYVSPTVFRVTIEESSDLGDSGNVKVSPPYLKYFMKDDINDGNFYETDKRTYDSISVSGLKDKKSAYEIEEIENYNKRIIRVLKPEVLPDFIEKFESLLEV